MNPTAAKLTKDIALADERIASLEAQCRKLEPTHRAQVEHQIKLAKNQVRDMRIQLAAISDLSDNRCPHCTGLKTHSFLVCIPCWRDTPFKLWPAWKGAVGLHHHGKVSAGYLEDAKERVLAHLRINSSAIL